jgi:hypothetical protein
MVGRGIRAGVSSQALDRHLMSTPMKVPMRNTTPVDRTRQSPPHTNAYDSPNTNNNSSPLRGLGGGHRLRNRSISPNRTKTATTAANTGSTPPRARLTYTRTRSGDTTRDPPPIAAISNKYTEAAGEAVCDYDSSATVLYELLESSSWERARSRCRSHPDEVRTWIVRKDKSLQVRWKLLPLHAAIIFQAPNFLVSTLLEKYPAAALRKDDQGMLPLHLAFRHKQEDEDLLELLLVHYPKAISIKDRRDRVPLEHGRESKFSAKLMRLYADANVAATRAAGITNVDDNQIEEVAKGGNLTGGQRAILEAEYKEKILAVKVDYEKQIRKMKTQLADELAEFDQKNQEKVLAVKDEYEEEIRKLKESQERRLASIHDHHQNTIRQMERSREEERQAARQQHDDEVGGLREILASQVAKDKELTDSLEKEIAHLQLGLQERRTECELARGQYDELQAYNNDLREVFEKVTTHQVQLQDMIAKQQEEIESHRNSRYKLIQTLLRHEDDHGESEMQQVTKMIELCDKTRRKIDYAQEKGMLADSNEHDGPERQEPRRHDRLEARIDSRMDRERDSDAHLKQERALQDDVERERNRIDRDPYHHDSPIDTAKDHGYKGALSPTGKSKEQEYGEVRILADEISAITENSDF